MANIHIVPVVRPKFNPKRGEATDVSIREGYFGVVVVEQISSDDTNGTVLRIAAYANHGYDPISYTKPSDDPVYAVDLPVTNKIDLREILAAIVNADPNRPVPPVKWG